jgi:hypothetical protein
MLESSIESSDAELASELKEVEERTSLAESKQLQEKELQAPMAKAAESRPSECG